MKGKNKNVMNYIIIVVSLLVLTATVAVVTVMCVEYSIGKQKVDTSEEINRNETTALEKQELDTEKNTQKSIEQESGLEQTPKEELEVQVDEEQLLKTYLKEVLVPEFGIFDTAEQSVVFSNGEDFFLGGIESAFINDLDCDGHSEMLVMYQKNNEQQFYHALAVYRIEAGAVCLADEVAVETYHASYDYGQINGLIKELYTVEIFRNLRLYLIDNVNSRYILISTVDVYDDTAFENQLLYSFSDAKIHREKEINYNNSAWEDGSGLYVIGQDDSKEQRDMKYESLCEEVIGEYAPGLRFELGYPLKSFNITKMYDLEFIGEMYEIDLPYKMAIVDNSGFREW